MGSNVIDIVLPNGEFLELQIDGSDFKEFSLEKKGTICKYLRSMLKTKEMFSVPYCASQNEYLNELFVRLVEQLRFEEYGVTESNYEHVNSPTHYNTYPFETIDMMISVWGKERVADWCEITAFKYRMRMGTKPDNAIEQDLKKEQWYLNKAKELRKEIPIIKENEVVTTYC